jgi:hypothetical protein
LTKDESLVSRVLGLNGCEGAGTAGTYHFTDNALSIPPGGIFVKGWERAAGPTLFG